MTYKEKCTKWRWFIQLTTLEVEQFGLGAWERCSAESKGADATILAEAKYIVISTRSPAEWQIYIELQNAFT